jgi:hypothetical protein
LPPSFSPVPRHVLSFSFWSPAPLPVMTSPFLSRTASPTRREVKGGDSAEKSKGRGRIVKVPRIRGEDVKI